VAYSPRGGWPFKPPQLTTALEYTIVWIHVFRMPVFYVMAGFFAALLLARYGLSRAAENRFRRIVVPFVVGCIVLYPILAILMAVGRVGLTFAMEYILSGRFLARAHPTHLWFLEYLMVLYMLAIIIGGVVPPSTPPPVRAAGSDSQPARRHPCGT
jgi:glucans biosynthesis protein C